jgi:hypothetical protein
MSIPLSPETQMRVDILFVGEDRDEASRLLIQECGNNLPFLNNLDEYRLERFRFAALKLSEGKIPKLKTAIELAKLDWRDLLVAAEFAEDVEAHKYWKPTKG